MLYQNIYISTIATIKSYLITFFKLLYAFTKIFITDRGSDGFAERVPKVAMLVGVVLVIMMMIVMTNHHNCSYRLTIIHPLWMQVSSA